MSSLLLYLTLSSLSPAGQRVALIVMGSLVLVVLLGLPVLALVAVFTPVPPAPASPAVDEECAYGAVEDGKGGVFDAESAQD